MWDYYEGAAGLQMCDYVSYYLFERKSEDNVGTETHENYVSSIADLVYNNGMKCSLNIDSL